MIPRKIRWTRRALKRLDEIGSYISKHDVQAASRIISRIIQSMGTLANQPAMGRPGRIKGTRELIVADISYIVAYRLIDNEIHIITLMHSAQRWPETL